MGAARGGQRTVWKSLRRSVSRQAKENQNEVMSGVLEQRFREREASAVSVTKRPGRGD